MNFNVDGTVNFPDIIGKNMPTAQQFQTDLSAKVDPTVAQLFPILVTFFAIGLLLRGLVK